jgi:hypothetical protein
MSKHMHSISTVDNLLSSELPQNVTGSESPTEERVHEKSIGRSNLTLKNVINPLQQSSLTPTHPHIFCSSKVAPKIEKQI